MTQVSKRLRHSRTFHEAPAAGGLVIGQLHRKAGARRIAMSTTAWSRIWLVPFLILVPLGGCRRDAPQPGRVLDEALQASRDGGVPPRRRRGLLPRHGRRRAADRRRDQGPQHVDRLDRRQRSLLGHDLDDSSFGTLDFLKTLSSHPEPEVQPRQPLELPRPGQRALLREGHRPRPEPLRPLARHARSELPARSVREREEVSRRDDRRARQDPARRLLTTATPPASSACACSRIRTSTRPRAKKWDAGALLRRPELLPSRRIWSGRTASACRAASATSGRTRSSRPPTRRTRSGRT